MSRKKKKEFDLSGMKKLLRQSPRLDFENMTKYGPGLPLSHVPSADMPPLDIERDWQEMGERAWHVLERRRMRDILSCDDDGQPSEFSRYLELLRRSSPRYRDEIFIGIEPHSSRPVFVPRQVFERHAYVLGGSGSGKTSHAVTQILFQLSECSVGTRGQRDRPPILIIDLKQNGDRYLRAVAEMLAREREQDLKFFSNDPDYESLYFDPLYNLRHVRYPIKMLETLMKAFSLIYPEGYGSDFFTAEQRTQLMEILYADQRPTNMDQLIEFIRKAVRGKDGNADARGLYSALAALKPALHIHTDGSPIDDAERIDFERFFEESEVLYVHLDSRALGLLSRDVGKLLLFSLLETASQREKQGRKTQAFVVIDEFHRLAARNIVEMLEDARSAGIGFVLSHQSSSSLKTRDADLYGTLFENCSFKQCLTVEDPRVIELLREISGMKTEFRQSHSKSTTHGRSDSTGLSSAASQSKTVSDGFTSGPLGDSESHGRAWSRGSTGGSSLSHTEMESTSRSMTLKEDKVAGLTPEMITTVNDVNLMSLVHVKGAGDRCLSPTGGIPTLVQGLYPFTETTAQGLEKRPWALKPQERLDESLKPEQPRKASAPPRDAQARKTPGWNEGEKRSIEKRIKALAAQLDDQIFPEPLSAEQLARRHRTKIKRVLEMAKELGIAIADRQCALSGHDCKRLEARLGEEATTS